MAPMRRSQLRNDDHHEGEAEPTVSQLMSVMIQLAQNQQARDEQAAKEREERRAEREEQRLREERAREDRRAEKLAEREEARRMFVPRQGNIDSFFKLRPPSFYGSEDALAAEDWLKEVGRFLDAARVPEEDKVPFATLLLKSHAHGWWEAELPKYQAVDIVPTWAQFRTGFLKKFFPPTQETLMEKKFANLTQGSMTVDEYTAEFTRLSRFCPVIAASAPEMMKKYSRGLRQEIQDDFAAVDLTTFDAVLETARKLEQVHIRKRARVQQALARRPFQQQSSQQRPQQTAQQPPRPPPVPRFQQRPQLQYQESGAPIQSRSQIADDLPTCAYCHKRGHLRKDCWKANKLCLRCGAPGHVVAACPQPPAAGQPRPPLPSQRDVFRQQQGGGSQRRAQALQMIASAQEMLREEEGPEMVQGATVSIDPQDGQFFQGVSTGTETDEVVAGIALALSFESFL